MRIVHSELADDVVLNFLRGRCCECQYRWPSQTFCNRAKREIVRPEIVSPLAHAMSFVDDEQTHFASEQSLEEIPILESLGCQIEKLALFVGDLSMSFARLAGREMRMHRDSIDTLSFELVLLILHQGDEWAHYYCESRSCECSELIDERLAAAGWHYDECVATIEQSFDRLPLAAPEI